MGKKIGKKTIAKLRFALLPALLLPLFGPVPATAQARTAGIIGSKHDLSVTGPGEVKSLEETRICIFCHTPHNAEPQTPLWNREIDPQNYVLYESTTLRANPAQPSGPTRLCLSCHDGTIALGNLKSEPQPVSFTRALTGRPSLLGIDISDDHPVSFPYSEALPNTEMAPGVPEDLMSYRSGNIHCTTCHDAHDDSHSMFLIVDNRYSALCTRCHVNKQGWSTSPHRLSEALWTGLAPNPWPLNERLAPIHQRHSVAENGCENCHTSHNAAGPQRLLKVQAEEEICYPCHNGHVASYDIEARFQEIYSHPVEATTIGVTAAHHEPLESPLAAANHVECMDCHNPHGVNDLAATAPHVSGLLGQVSGISEDGLPLDESSYEYQVCLKCHEVLNDTSHSRFSINFITRHLDETATRQELFATSNPSYHPVFGQRSANVPSIPSSYVDMDQTAIIYCSDCHGDEVQLTEFAERRGPHGSSNWPILKQRYVINTGQANSAANYALCYGCHDFTSIQNNDSFQQRIAADFNGGGHSGHLAAGIPCSVCHDPHGVNDTLATGRQTNLINFDVNYVDALTGPTPIYNDLGNHSGSCVLVCHGLASPPAPSTTFTHNTPDSSYP